MNPRRWLPLAALLIVLIAGWWLQQQGPGEEVPPGSQSSSQSTDTESGLAWVDAADLPVEARQTLELIDAGGPYPHDEDDDVFENREGILPDRPRGHYREYTVETPGLHHRGARRIVAGADGELFWTDDHYESFRRIAR